MKKLKTAFDKIPERPEVPEAPTFNGFLTSLWETKDEWDGIREPLVAKKGELQEATAFEDASFT